MQLQDDDYLKDPVPDITEQLPEEDLESTEDEDDEDSLNDDSDLEDTDGSS